MDTREKIAEIICGHRLKDSFAGPYVTDQDREWLLKLADQVLAIIKQGEWLDKPDSEGWWWRSYAPRREFECVKCYYRHEDGTTRLVFMKCWQMQYCDSCPGQWCKAIVPE